MLKSMREKEMCSKCDRVEVRHGRWEYKEEHKGSKYGYYYCSICGVASWASKSPYCPNCGASMVNEDD